MLQTTLQKSISGEVPDPIAGREQERSFAKRLRSSAVWAAIGRLSAVLFLLLLNGHLTRTLSQEDYGRYTLLECAVLLISLLILGGLPMVGMRMLRKALVGGKTQLASQVVYSCMLIISFTAMVTTTVSWSFAWLTQNVVLPGTLWPYIFFAVAWATCTAVLRLISEFFRSYQRFGASAFLGGQRGGFGSNALLLLTAFAASATVGLTLNGILLIQIGVQLLLIALGAFWLLRETRQPSANETEPHTDQFKSTFREVLSRSWPLLIVQLVAFGLPEIDTLLVGSMMSAEDAAIYRPARLLTIVVSVPLLLVNSATQPFLTELHILGHTRKLAALVRGTATLAAIPSLALLAGFLLVPEWILSTTFGGEYVMAASTLRVLACGSAVFVLTGSCGMVLQMTGHERSAMARSIICAAIYLLAAPWLVYQYGIVGAATAAALLQAISNIMTTIMVYRYEKIWTTATFSIATMLECYRLVFPKRVSAGVT